MGNSKNINQLKKDILKFKKSLISKAKKKGIYEDFGQKEVHKMNEKYDFWNGEVSYLIQEFDKWCINFDDRQLNFGGVFG